MKKIANYSSLHNFEFTPDGLRVWKAYNIGTGKLISWESVILYPQEATGLVEEKLFTVGPNHPIDVALEARNE